jgi:hypothetical protein
LIFATRQESDKCNFWKITGGRSVLVYFLVSPSNRSAQRCVSVSASISWALKRTRLPDRWRLPSRRFAPTSALTLSAAVFNGNPAPAGPGDPQVRNSSGTNFLIGEGGFMPIAEISYSFDEQAISSTLLSDVKLGAWYHTAEFPDLRRHVRSCTDNGLGFYYARLVISSRR